MSKIKVLTDREFENLIFDLICDTGFENVQWRTPGADGGRDIEATSAYVDLSGFGRNERWHIECKRYESAISWPIVFQKVAYAESSGVDNLLVVTSSTFSPKCIDEVNKWNEKRSVKIRIWSVHDLERLLSNRRILKLKYGIESASIEISYVELIDQIAQISYGLAGSEANGRMFERLELLNLLSMNFHRRMLELRQFGRYQLRKGPLQERPWLNVDGGSTVYDCLSVECVVAALRYCFKEIVLNVSISEVGVTIAPTQPIGQFVAFPLFKAVKMLSVLSWQISGSNLVGEIR